ncbi:MAG: pilus assembly protein TadG-related protein [Pseudomonadota bacterium]
MFSEALKRTFKRFPSAREGNVAIIFGLAVLPIFLAGGVAIDYGRAVMTKNKLQAAADAAALAAASMQNADEQQRTEMARSVFATNFTPQRGVSLEPLDIEFVDEGVRVTPRANVETVLMKLAGIQQMPLKTTVEVNLLQPRKAEIALVLDYSGSMGQTLNGEQKFITMRDAAKGLVSEISDAAADGDIKVGLVPFSHHVYTSLPGEHIIGGTPGTTWTGCTYDRKAPYNVTHDTPNRVVEDSKWGNTRSINRFDRHGCNGYVRNSLYVQPLTSNTEAIQSQLDEMTPYAWTNIALGMAFGWHMLSPNSPYTEGTSYSDKETLKAIVLLTDGAQTAYSWGPNGRQTQRNGERNLETMCSNIKALNDDPDEPNFIIITVAFDLDDPDTVNRLRGCASSDEFFYEADDNAQLSAAFEGITKQLSKAIALTR